MRATPAIARKAGSHMSSLHKEISDLASQADECGRQLAGDPFACPKEARKKAMDFLARREYGRVELIRKLADKGFERNVAEEAVSRLTADGLQSDDRFTEAFVQSRINQGKGPVRIRLDLGQKGISDSTIEIALEEADPDWRALAREQRVKKFGGATPSDFKEKARQMRFLQYRGFEQDHIQSAF